MSRYNPELHENVYITPEWITKPLGYFHLDPASPNPQDMPYRIANMVYTEQQDGLSKEWTKSWRIWLNPPYIREKGRTVEDWVIKMTEHNNGIMLIGNNTETSYWQDYILNKAYGIFLLKGRINFWDLTGKPRRNKQGKLTGNQSGSVLVAYGRKNYISLKRSGLEGKLIKL